MDWLTVALFVGLLLSVCRNWVKSSANADTLSNLANDDHTSNELRLFKKKMNLEIQLIKNKLDAEP